MAAHTVVVYPISQPSVKARKFKAVKITGGTDIGAQGVGYAIDRNVLGFNFVEGAIGAPVRTGTYYMSPTALGASGLTVLYFNLATGVQAAAAEAGVNNTIGSILVYGY